MAEETPEVEVALGTEQSPGGRIVQKTGELVKDVWNRFLGTQMESPISGTTTRAQLYKDVIQRPAEVVDSTIGLGVLCEALGSVIFGSELPSRERVKYYSLLGLLGLAGSVPEGALSIANIPVTEVSHGVKTVADRIRSMFGDEKDAGLTPPPESQIKT
jgi:hypothetical protein